MPCLLAMLCQACSGEYSAVLSLDVGAHEGTTTRGVSVTVMVADRSPKTLLFRRDDGSAFALSPPHRLDVTFRTLPGREVDLAVATTTEAGELLYGCAHAQLSQGKPTATSLSLTTTPCRSGASPSDGPAPDAARDSGPDDGGARDGGPGDGGPGDGGACTPACTNDHGRNECVARTCHPTCEAGFDDCDQLPANGCETSLHSLASCGACGVPCARDHAAATCATGTCAIERCLPGFVSCDGQDANGCEADLGTPTNTPPGEDLMMVDADSSTGRMCMMAPCALEMAKTRMGTGARYFHIVAHEKEMMCMGRVALRFELLSPTGADYDLVVSGGCTCTNGLGAASCSSQSTTGSDVVNVSCPKTAADDSFTAQAEIRFSGGSSCAAWTLNVYAGGC